MSMQGTTRGCALVTGASTGIGRAIALRLARDGYDVLAGVRRPASLAELEAERRGAQPLLAGRNLQRLQPLARDARRASPGGVRAANEVFGMSHSRSAIVIGAGIGGLTAAAALQRAGLRVQVFERAAELREAGAGLGIMTNAVGALRALGVNGELEAAGQVIEEFQIRHARGRLIASMPLKELADELGAPSVSIQRGALQRVLLAAADGCKLQLGAECLHAESDAEGVTAYFASGASARADILIAADGIHSVVRRQLTGPEPAPYAGYVCWLACVPFRHPRLTRGYVGHYWGRGIRFGLVDVGKGQVYWWVTQNCPERSLSSPASPHARAAAAVSGWADEVVSAVASTPESAVLEIPARDRPFLARWGAGRTTLLGDAAHPMLTSLGQGACMAIEDAVVLGRCLQAGDPVAGLRRYEALRRERTRRMVLGSRLLAAIEQAQHPLTAALRDAYFRHLPRRIAREQTRSIFEFTYPWK